MTYLEYNKHYRAKYDNAKEKITNYNTRLNELIEKAKEELNKEFVRIEQYNFPDMLDLHKSIMEKFLEIEEEIKSYCENHELLIFKRQSARRKHRRATSGLQRIREIQRYRNSRTLHR